MRKVWDATTFLSGKNSKNSKNGAGKKWDFGTRCRLAIVEWQLKEDNYWCRKGGGINVSGAENAKCLMALTCPAPRNAKGLEFAEVR
jgi:hypothetical protein